MSRLGIDPAGIEVVFISHFHGDHVLGLPPFLLHRALVGGGPLRVVGGAGIEGKVMQLLDLAWAGEWSTLSQRFDLSFEEARGYGEVCGMAYEPVALDHGRIGCTGFRIKVGDRLLAYAGDSEATPPLDQLVQGADIAIVEATAPGEVHSHTSWEDAHRLRDRHPQTRFFFNHIYAGELDGSVNDLQSVDV